MIGTQLRMGNVIRSDGRTVIVAMDHGGYMGPTDGIRSPRETVREIVRGGADAVILTPGMIRHCADLLTDVGVILRIDGSGSVDAGESGGPYQLVDLKEAVKFGVDGVIAMGFLGVPEERKSLELLASIINDGRKYGVPVVAEMFPRGSSPPEPLSVERGARIGSEMGADLIKTFYTGDRASFETVVESTPTDIVVLGGQKRETTREVLTDVRNAVDCGAIGIAIGRNIWQSGDTEGTVRAMVKLVHEDVSPDTALEVIDG